MTQPLGDQFHIRTHVDVLDRKRVPKAMWAEGVRELFVLLRPFGRVDTLAERAQKDKKFTHAFSPHCLRHTFAIQHINVGTDVKLISKWLGHESVAVTLQHYGNWIKETQKLAEDVSRDANAKMMAKVTALRNR